MTAVVAAVPEAGPGAGSRPRGDAAVERPRQVSAAGETDADTGREDAGGGRYATAIHDPVAFATAFVRGTEHPEVRQVLESPYDPEVYLPDVSIPIEELLGADGPRYCTGYRLAPIAGDTRAAMDCREAWVDARANDRDPDVPPPRAVPVDSFDDAEVKFFFRPTRAKDGYEIATMYVVPSDEI